MDDDERSSSMSDTSIETLTAPSAPENAVIVASKLAKNDDEKFTVYKIVVAAGGQTFSIYRRYNDFYALHYMVC
jgi:hypothetical protein